MHYTDSQTLTKVDALFMQDFMEPDFIPIEGIELMGTG
jgi:hypothetical protein